MKSFPCSEELHLFFMIITLDISSHAGMCMPMVSSEIQSKLCIYNASQGIKKYAKCPVALSENKNDTALSENVNNTTTSDINATDIHNSSVTLNSTNPVDLESTTKESKPGSITSNRGTPSDQHDSKNGNSTTISVVTVTLILCIVLVAVVCFCNRKKVKTYCTSAKVCRNPELVDSEQESTDNYQDDNVSKNGKLEDMSRKALLDVKGQPISPELQI